MKGCLPNLIKYGLIFTNTGVILMGLATLGIGIYALSDGDRLADLVEFGSKSLGEGLVVIDLYTTGAMTVVAASSVVIVVAFLGCCGACKENKCMIFSFYVSLLVLFIGVVVSATIAFTQSIDVLRAPLIRSLSEYEANSTDPDRAEVAATWDDLQIKFNCCGVDGYLDWTNSNYSTCFPTEQGHRVPKSCCQAFGDVEDCAINPSQPLYQGSMKGCLLEFRTSLEKNKENIEVVTAAIIFFMFVNLVGLFIFAMSMLPDLEYKAV